MDIESFRDPKLCVSAPLRERVRIFLLPALLAFIQIGLAQRPDPEEVQRAVSMAVAGDYSPALAVFRSELLKDPGDPLLNYFVGMTLYKLDRAAAAVPYFEKAVREKAPFPQAFYWLARAYLEGDRDESASAIVKRGLERFPDNRDLRALASELAAGEPQPR